MGEEELWQSKSADLEKIEGWVWNAGDQKIRTIKATNEELGGTGDLGKRGENPLKGNKEFKSGLLVSKLITK